MVRHGLSHKRSGSLAMGFAAMALAACLTSGIGLMSYQNTFAAGEEEVRAKWAQVDNQLKRRADLIPNLVQAVKGYAGHEKEVLSAVANARTGMLSARNVEERMRASHDLTNSLSRLISVTESYPALKSDAAFTRLMDELAGTENRLSVERQRYNEAVQRHNAGLKRMPGSLIGRTLGFEPAKYFEIAPADTATPKVAL